MICVANTVYIDVGVKKVGDKVYPRFLIRESYWENGRSRQRTIANISDCPLEDINAMRLALKWLWDNIILSRVPCNLLSSLDWYASDSCTVSGCAC